MSARSRRRRGNREVLAGLVGLFVAGMAAAWVLQEIRSQSVLRDAFPQSEGPLEVAGLRAPVVIDRDRRGIPHVSAANAADGWFGVGFVHAQDRLAQMLWLRMLAHGRAAEFLGEAALPADELARVMDFRTLGSAQLEAAGRQVRRTLEAYAEGVNARIARIEAGDVGAPSVVRRLGLPLDPWRPEDSLAVLKLYAWSLGQSLDASLLLQDVMEHVGATGARPFFPGGRSEDPPPVQRTAGHRPAPAGLSAPLRWMLGLHGPSIGSSAWVVGGRHTESGLPILMADAHLAATAPPYLHLDRLRHGDLDVAGAMLPGVPVFWTGRNRELAWASVNAPAVVTDLYTETVDDSGDEPRYHDGKRWRGLVTRVEVLSQKGGPDRELRVHATRHGPLLPPSISSQPLSVAWVGARSDGESAVGSFLAVAAAGSADELVAALADHQEPALLMMYADAAGGAGMQMAGWIPSRSLSAELMPLPGRARWYDWNERVPYEALPRGRLEAGRGWLVAADAAFDSRDPDHAIDWLWRSGNRTKRIDALLREAVGRGPVGLKDLAPLQRDVHDPGALALVRDALALVDDEDAPPLPRETRELVEILADWDGRVTAESVGATAYHMFSISLTDLVLEEQLGETLLHRYLALAQANPERVAHDLVHQAARAQGRGRWAPVVDAVRSSLRDAWLRLSYELGANRRRWTWGRLHALRFRPFAAVGGGPQDAGLVPIPYGGNGSTIDTGAYDPSSPFAVRVASTLRFAVDAASLDQGLVSLAPGQSEHPGHPHYDDGLPGWRSGQGDLLASGRLLVEESSEARLVLEPAR